jgi:hypothetical protein
MGYIQQASLQLLSLSCEHHTLLFGLGGTIHFDSVPRQGTSCTVFLPLEIGTATTEVKGARSQAISCRNWTYWSQGKPN